MSTFVLHFNDYNGNNQKKSANEYDYIEIGTCDWDVMSMTKPGLKGVVIEPIKIYIDNIPNNANVIKVNKAISTNNSEDYMYYIPPEIIEEKSIVNCFRGMNKLGSYHQGAVSNNLTSFVKKEKCDVITYFELLKQYNIEYVDLLKIDTEGHDCSIINNILDNLSSNPHYVLPRYILFENNGLTPLQTRIDTMYRLYTVGYVHIYTEDDNTFLYNCTTYYLNLLKSNNIHLPRNKYIDTVNQHYFQDVHSYMTYGQIDLFKNLLHIKVVDDPSNSNIIWTTQAEDDHNRYSKENCSAIINIIHGGGFIYSNLLKKDNLNIMVKSITDYVFLQKTQHNVCLYVGKYKSQEKKMIEIFNYRQKHMATLHNFLMLNGCFKFNPTAVKDTYNDLKQKYVIDLYGYDADKGWANIFDNDDITTNVLSQYKFMLHLKGNGYLCNSVICAGMAGMPIIMSRDVYIKTLYYQFIPEDLIILIENDDIARISSHSVSPVLDKVLTMSDADYMSLSKKLHIHFTFFRENYTFELEHLYNFMNNLHNKKL